MVEFTKNGQYLDRVRASINSLRSVLQNSNYLGIAFDCTIGGRTQKSCQNNMSMLTQKLPYRLPVRL